MTTEGGCFNPVVNPPAGKNTPKHPQKHLLFRKCPQKSGGGTIFADIDKKEVFYVFLYLSVEVLIFSFIRGCLIFLGTFFYLG